MLNWDDMRVFLAVARAESLSAAAPKARMDPATLGRRIARLEAELGQALFVKSPQGYRLTEVGERMRDEAADAEIAFARALDARATAEAGLSGQIRIGAPDGCAGFLLPQVCAKIQAGNPELEIQILSLPRIVNLSQREADLAITVSPPKTGRYTVQKITDYSLHLAMRGDIEEPQSLSDLAGIPVVGYIQDMIFDQELDYLNVLPSPDVRLTSNSVTVQMQLLEKSKGIGFVHDFALPAFPRLKRVLADEVGLKRSYYLVRHTSDRGSDRLRRFSQALTKGLQAEVARLESAAALGATSEPR